MARSKSPTGSKTDKKDSLTTNIVPSVPATQTGAAGTTKVEAQAPERPEAKKLGVVKTDSRTNVVPINLDDEIRRRAYELYVQRGYISGYETEDWLVAEREVLQRYHQQSA